MTKIHRQTLQMSYQWTIRSFCLTWKDSSPVYYTDFIEAGNFKFYDGYRKNRKSNSKPLTRSYDNKHSIDRKKQVLYTVNKNNKHVALHFGKYIIHQLQRNCFIIKDIQFRQRHICTLKNFLPYFVIRKIFLIFSKHHQNIDKVAACFIYPAFALMGTH